MQTTEIVYKNRSNINQVLFYEDLVAMDFQSVTRVVCNLYNIDNKLITSIDSNSSPSLITWTDTTTSPNLLNAINFTFNGLSLNGSFYAEVYVYSPSYTLGRVLAHPRSPDDLLCFNFVNA